MATDGRGWFKLFPAEFLAGDAALLSNEEFGVLMRLLFHNWIAESLPNQVEQLARLAVTDLATFEPTWAAIKHNFEAVEPDATRITNPVLAGYEVRRALISESKAAAGRASGKAKRDGNIRETYVCPGVEHSEKHPSNRVEESRVEQSRQGPPKPPLEAGGEGDPEGGPPNLPGKPQEPQNGTAKRKRTKGKPIPLPDGFEPTAANVEWFRGRYGEVPKREVDHQTEQFKTTALRDGKVFIDWQAAWRTWVNNWQTDFGKNPPAPTPPSGLQPWEANGDPNLLRPDDEPEPTDRLRGDDPPAP